MGPLAPQRKQWGPHAQGVKLGQNTHSTDISHQGFSRDKDHTGSSERKNTEVQTVSSGPESGQERLWLRPGENVSEKSSCTDRQERGHCGAERQNQRSSGHVYYKIKIANLVQKRSLRAAPQPTEAPSGALAQGLSDAKVSGQEGSVPGRGERQVGAPGLVQNVEWVGQRAGVKALLCHPNLLLLEGLCGGQGLLGRGRSDEAEGRGTLPSGSGAA